MENDRAPAIRVVVAADLSPGRRDALHQLFDDTYERADHVYLDGAFEMFRFAALAVLADGDVPGTRGKRERIVGFALGESRGVELPHLSLHTVALAGLCCVDAAYRRDGLFRTLEMRAVTEGMTPNRGRVLAAGRMAHPASFRVMRHHAGALPRPGRTPSPVQQAVARAIADCYAVDDFDPVTFACRGRGHPIGTPRVAVEATEEEWELFENIDRDRGDSLLALCWMPDAPPGW
ncbi:MAG TPA: hypothetical protein VMA83_08145 [Solirubrobacteraceae bacterium]|nr:hypothetical protein [Solirubrobacteraceae bacterium]